MLGLVLIGFWVGIAKPTWQPYWPSRCNFDSFAVGVAQLAHAAGESIFCREGW